MSYLYILKINPLLIASFANIFSLDCRLSFYFVHGFLCCAKAFKFSQVPCVYFCFYFHYSRRCVIEDLAVIYVEECSAYVFSSKSFIVSGLKFRSLIHFEFIFIRGVGKYFNLIVLYVTILYAKLEFSWHHC